MGDGEATAPDIAAAEGADAPKDEGPTLEDAKGNKAAKKNLEKPDSKTIEAHNRGGHVPFAPWCAHCRAARATMQPHHGTPQEKENEVDRPPMLVMDYMYMGRAKEAAKRPIIAAREESLVGICRTY